MTQRVFISGGASGLGRALALRWAQTGAKVCIGDLNEVRGAEAVAEIEAAGGEGYYLHCDVTSETDLATACQAMVARWGGVDLVVCNAGVASGGTLQDETLAQWQWVIDINLLGVVRTCKAFVDQFVAQGSGYFLNVASQAGLTPMGKMGSYNATKCAVVGFTETIRFELASDNIGASVLCPAFFRTNLGESLRTDDPRMHGFLEKMFANAKLTAADVADKAYRGVQKRQLLIQTHPEGIRAYRVKRWFPNLFLKQAMTFYRRMSK